MNITITISTPERVAGLIAATDVYNLANGASLTPAAYAQFAWGDGACDSYAAQYDVKTVEGLANRLSIESDARARAESDASAKAEQLAAEKAKTATLEAEKAGAAGGLVGELAKA